MSESTPRFGLVVGDTCIACQKPIAADEPAEQDSPAGGRWHTRCADPSLTEICDDPGPWNSGSCTKAPGHVDQGDAQHENSRLEWRALRDLDDMATVFAANIAAQDDGDTAPNSDEPDDRQDAIDARDAECWKFGCRLHLDDRDTGSSLMDGGDV